MLTVVAINNTMTSIECYHLKCPLNAHISWSTAHVWRLFKEVSGLGKSGQIMS